MAICVRYLVKTMQLEIVYIGADLIVCVNLKIWLCVLYYAI